MAEQAQVNELTVEQLRELAAQHNVEVADNDKKPALVEKVSAGITPEDLVAYKEQLNQSTDEGGDTPPSVKDVENQEANTAVAARKEDAVVVDTKLGTSDEEKAAKRAGVPSERLNDPEQNREPKNVFEQENQTVTEQERKAAQKASNVKNKEDKSQTPGELARQDAEQSAATNQGSEIAQAIADGLKRSSGDRFELEPELGVEPRFTLVRSKQTGEVLLRDNGDGTLSKIQLESLEEKEASIQNQEVEEL